MSCDYQQLPHTGIKALNPYVPGKSVEELAREQGITDIIKLASNENPYGCSPRVREALANMSGVQIATYPSPMNHPLTAKLSDYLEINPASLAFCNGSDLLFTLLLTIFGLHSNKHMLTHDKAFMSYEIQANILGIPVKSTPLNADWQVDISAMIKASNAETAIIFLANPNNPTGILIPKEEIKELLENILPSTIVVLDEAYCEYAHDDPNDTALSLLTEFPNLVISRTFSKIYGLAGLRLGYAIAHPSIIQLLHRVQPPFSVNQAALTAAYAALDDQDFVRHTKEMNSQGMEQMQEGLASLHLEMLPSHCNFISFDCQTAALPVYQTLLQKGVIVRPLNAYGMNNHLRVSIGKPKQNARFIDTLSQVLANHGP